MTDSIRYKGCWIVRTQTTTTVRVKRNLGLGLREEIRPLFRIEGRLDKPHGLRPFLTTIKEAKEWISHEDTVAEAAQ